MVAPNSKVSLADLSIGVVSVDLVSPAGHRFTVKMRALKGHERRNVQVAKPEPPVADYRRNPASQQIEAVYNEHDPEYLRALDEYNERLAITGLLLSLQDVDIPGETIEEQVEAFRQGADMWATQQLLGHFNRINGFGEEAMQEAMADLTPFSAASTPSSEDSGGT